MNEVSMFVEDAAHRHVIGALVQRVADDVGMKVRMDWRSAVGGHGRVVKEFGRYLRDLDRQGPSTSRLVVVATDANCKGHMARAKEIGGAEASLPVVRAIPDPHIERWLLLDGAAFKRVFGKGCQAPDQKCERGRYKHLLTQAIRNAGATPLLGGIEHAAEIVAGMDLVRAGRADPSLQRFLDDLREALWTWR